MLTFYLWYLDLQWYNVETLTVHIAANMHIYFLWNRKYTMTNCCSTILKGKGNIQNVKLVENFVFKHKRIEDVAKSFDICLTYIIVQYDQGNGYACTKANRHTLWVSNFFYVIIARKLRNGFESRNQFKKNQEGAIFERV